MRNKLTDELAVCGLNAIRSLNEVHPEKVNRLFLREDRLPLFTGLCRHLAERKRPYKLCENEELEKICKTSHHQGIVAMIFEPKIKAASPEDIDAWAAEGKTGLLLCDVGNDHNLGAIVRAAAFFDAPLIILTESNEEEAKRLTTSAYRVAEGGMEYVEFRSIRSPAAFLRSVSKKLITIGTDPRARIRIRDIPYLEEVKQKKTGAGHPGMILVIGNEETGLPGEIREQCSIMARIPGTGAIESLNAAQAAALFLQELYERFA
ncbi:MAG: RNA methyltransferase [Treponema sp.]|nr:RNA methyltransferase [Treponema sp.]